MCGMTSPNGRVVSGASARRPSAVSQPHDTIPPTYLVGKRQPNRIGGLRMSKIKSNVKEPEAQKLTRLDLSGLLYEAKILSAFN